MELHAAFAETITVSFIDSIAETLSTLLRRSINETLTNKSGL